MAPRLRSNQALLAPVSCARLFLGAGLDQIVLRLVICPGLEAEGCVERPGDENITSCKISTCSLCYSKEKDGGRVLTRGFALCGSLANRRVLGGAPVTGGVCAAELFGWSGPKYS